MVVLLSAFGGITDIGNQPILLGTVVSRAEVLVSAIRSWARRSAFKEAQSHHREMVSNRVNSRKSFRHERCPAVHLGLARGRPVEAPFIGRF